MRNSCESISHGSSYQRFQKLFQGYLQKHLPNGSMCKLWLSYVSMAETLLNMMYG